MKNQSALVNLLTIATTSRCLQNYSALSPFPVSIRGCNFLDGRDLHMLSAESLALFIVLTIATGIRQLLYEAALVFFIIPTKLIQFWIFLAPVSYLTLANEMLFLQNQSSVENFFFTIATEIRHFQNNSALVIFLTIATETCHLQNHSALVIV